MGDLNTINRTKSAMGQIFEELELELFEVKVNMPVYRSTYWVVAKGYDEAVAKVMAAETKHGATNGGIESIASHGAAYGDDGALLTT